MVLCYYAVRNFLPVVPSSKVHTKRWAFFSYNQQPSIASCRKIILIFSRLLKTRTTDAVCALNSSNNFLINSRNNLIL